MASLILGGIGSGIGASIGGSFLGMSASSIGWMLGSTLGNLLFAEKQHIYGPRLKGDRFSGSALGQVRPIVYGTCKVEGKIIWQTPYHEHEHTEDSGGKGGGTEYTTYTYTRSFAVALCEGPIEGVRKIWLNGKLEFDFSESANVAAGIESGTKIQDIRIYYGSSTQNPDPTIESFEGSGNVPGYRGTAYIVFTEYDVTDSQGACPIVEVEVVANASESSSTALGIDINDETDTWGQIGYVSDGVLYYAPEDRALGVNYFRRLGIDLSSGNVVFRESYGKGYGTGYQRGPYADDMYYIYHMSTDYIDAPSLENAMIATYAKLPTGEAAYVGRGVLLNKNGTTTLVGNFGGWRSAGTLEKFYFKRGIDQTYLFATSIAENTDQKRWVQRWDMPGLIAEERYDFADGTYNLQCYPADTGDVYVLNANDSKVYRFDIDLNLIESKTVPTGKGSSDCIAYADGLIWFGSNMAGASGSATIAAYNWDDMSLVGSVSNLSYGVSVRTTGRTFSMYASGNAAVVTIDTRLWTVAVRRITRQSATLSDIVADLHQRCGQTTDDYDVSALTDDVRGYLITEQVTARSCIEQLQIGFLFDAKDSEGKIKYVKRGSSSAATLTADDLGAFENEPSSGWQVTRQQEEELPQTLSVVYMDYNGSYEKAAQNATRQAVLSGDVATFQVPIVFTANEAQSIAQKQQMAAWVGRTKYAFTTNMEWVKLEPCDVVTVQGKVMRLTSRNDGVNGIIEFEGVAELPDIYTNTGVGALPSGYEETSLRAKGPTVFDVLDVPPLTDGDYDSYVEYLAATGVLDGWTAGAIFRSTDGTSFSFASLINTASVIGYAENVLGDWTGGNVFDEKNSVTIRTYGSGELSGVSYEQSLNKEFVFLLGNEIIYGRDATLIDTNQYKLTGLLRGRLGTDWAMGGHAVNDRFVLLNSSTIKKYIPSSTDLNTVRYFKGVTTGNRISSAIAKSHTYTGKNITPFSPCNIGGGKTSTSSNWTIKWMRRSRYLWEWLNNRDVGADEGSYDFNIRIYNNPDSPTSVIRTIAVTGLSVGSDGFFSTTYSAANQSTDFGQYQQRLAVSVQQVGEHGNSEWSDIVTLESGFSVTYISSILLHFNGTNNSTTFTDEYGNTVTANGNAKLSTAQFKFGSASLLLDGTTDWAYVAPFAIGLSTNDFTIECFVRWNSVTNGGIFHLFPGTPANVTTGLAVGYNGTAFEIYNNGSSVSRTYSVSTGVWYHVALTRVSNQLYLYINGVQQGAAIANSTNYSSGNGLNVGLYYSSSFTFNGYIDELRVTRFGARYTGNFTPPSAEFTE
jgi:hypothetical protein